MSTTGFDVFVSYSHADAEWVSALAENLHEEDLEVFFDEWVIGAGDVVVHRLDEGLRTTRNGVLVVSPALMASKWVAEEYAAMIVRAVDRDLRLIPVLYGDAEMPPLLASMKWIDFRGADGPTYERRLRELVEALHGRRPGPPPRGGVLKPPSDSRVRADSQLRHTRWVDRVDLRELVDDPGAQGVAYISLATGAPLLQLHEFGSEFSLFWHHRPERLDPNLFVSTFINMAVAPSRSLPTSSIRAEALMPGQTKHWELEEDETYLYAVANFLPARLPLPDVSDVPGRLLWFVRKRWEQSASFQLSIDGIRANTRIWADRPAAELPSPEIGLISGYEHVDMRPLVRIFERTVASNSVAENWAIVRAMEDDLRKRMRHQEDP